MRRLLAIILLLVAVSCQRAVEPGVSLELAQDRAASISDLSYTLSFDIPESCDSSISATETVSFILGRRKDIILDFKPQQSAVVRMEVNGKALDVPLESEHLVVPRSYARRGLNTMSFSFIAGTQSLNRREEFLYTLLVPDRARTLFPCFDQPDLKARCELSLRLPEGWTAVSNTSVVSEEPGLVRFGRTEPLSTYLFSFVAGKFDRVRMERGGRSISMYHRETDPDKVAQCPEVLSQVFDAIEWMEDYTAVPYPFAKYDFVVIPDFQYGGMEHTGATLYNDSRIFLDKGATTVDRLEQSSLIAHETAHMWFGDLVTMRWFSGVWTKEVFANWFAYKMIRPLFPDVDFTLNDLKFLYASAYSEDRTPGAAAIQRPLDNLQNAGLIYNNTIYDKAPVVLEKLYRLMGEEQMKAGLREYLSTYAYSNADWDDLVRILDRRTDVDVQEWSRVWVHEKGMPVYTLADGELIQSDPFGAGNVWQQYVDSRMLDGGIWLPNLDGTAYGAFILDDASREYVMAHWTEFDDVGRMSLLMTLYENMERGVMKPSEFVAWSAGLFAQENNPLVLSSMLSYAGRAMDLCPQGSDCELVYEASLIQMLSSGKVRLESRYLALRSLWGHARRGPTRMLLFNIWRQGSAGKNMPLGERDRTELAYKLMVWYPAQYDMIRDAQRELIDNRDRLSTFDFVCKACCPDSEVRSAIMQSMLEDPGMRRPESRALSALRLLCCPERGDERLQYIQPSLDRLEQIQRTGDIFFPGSWCKSLLGRQDPERAYTLAQEWIEQHPECNPLLVCKIQQAML